MMRLARPDVTLSVESTFLYIISPPAREFWWLGKLVSSVLFLRPAALGHDDSVDTIN
jgi:hypothetical protein